jgi:hypothetical protein
VPLASRLPGTLFGRNTTKGPGDCGPTVPQTAAGGRIKQVKNLTESGIAHCSVLHVDRLCSARLLHDLVHPQILDVQPIAMDAHEIVVADLQDLERWKSNNPE